MAFAQRVLLERSVARFLFSIGKFSAMVREIHRIHLVLFSVNRWLLVLLGTRSAG